MSQITFVLNVLIAISTLQAVPIVRENGLNSNEVGSEELSEYEEQWIEQEVDHFNILDNRTFLMRYFEEDKYFKPGGPLLINIGGEGFISSDSITGSPSYRLAILLHGKIVLIEHRYYGKSCPFENFTTENLLYLSVEQTLADLTYFVETYKNSTPGLQNSKVAVFGCSYSAALATWFRYKYPHVVDAAWASSAPLRAVADFYEYLEVASEVYANVSAKCYETFKKGYDETKLILATDEGLAGVRNSLTDWGCGSIAEMDAKEILGNVRYVIADHNIQPDHGVESCRVFEKSANKTAHEQLVDFLLLKAPDVCPGAEDDEYPNDGLAWNYQTCTEFGYSVTTSSKNQPFNDSISILQEDLQICSELFGEDFTSDLMQKGIRRINREYGSVHLKATKVLSIHGTQDPWHKLGLYEEQSEEAPVILIPGASHCPEYISIEKEPIELSKAKLKAIKIMRKWLV